MNEMMRWCNDHSIMILLAFGTAFSWFWLHRNREKLGIKPWAAPLLAAAHTLIGVLSVKIFAVMETLDLNNIGNMSLFGGVFFMPLVYWLGAVLFKRKKTLVFDVFTICMVFTVMCARVNCILTGCCLGRTIPGTSGMRWPTREAEIVYYLILLAVLWRRTKKGQTHGTLYPLYMASYGALRFFLEGFRVSDSQSVLHLSHAWAALAFCLGLSIYSQLTQDEKRRKQHG